MLSEMCMNFLHRMRDKSFPSWGFLRRFAKVRPSILSDKCSSLILSKFFTSKNMLSCEIKSYFALKKTLISNYFPLGCGNLRWQHGKDKTKIFKITRKKSRFPAIIQRCDSGRLTYCFQTISPIEMQQNQSKQEKFTEERQRFATFIRKFCQQLRFFRIR